MLKHLTDRTGMRQQTHDTLLNQSFLEVVPEILKENHYLTLIKEIEDSIQQENFSQLFHLLKILPVEHLRKIREINRLIQFAFIKKEYTLISLVEKHLGQWGKNRFNGKTAAQLAAAEGKWDELLVIASHREAGQKGEIIDGGLGAALFTAAEQSQWDIVSTLITKYKVTHFSWHYPENGCFAIHFAIKAKRLDIVQLFIDNRMDINCQSGNNMPPLHLAMATADCEKIGIYLLSKGANYNIKCKGEPLLNLDGPVLNFPLIRLIVLHATYPLTRIQLNKILITAVEHDQYELCSSLLAMYSSRITQGTKNQALDLARGLRNEMLFRLLWPHATSSLEEKMSEPLASNKPVQPNLLGPSNQKEYKLSNNNYAFIKECKNLKPNITCVEVEGSLLST